LWHSAPLRQCLPPPASAAGAGSGKTETLIRRVADLILAGEAPGRLLCITFTAKAAGEMRGRHVPGTSTRTSDDTEA